MSDYGQIAVGMAFNPSGDDKVSQVKQKFADIINILDDLRADCSDKEKSRLIEIAITEAQTAQMWAVKAITFK